MTQALPNGSGALHVINGVNGNFGNPGHSANAATSGSMPAEPSYEEDYNPRYTEGHTLEALASARSISNPYAGVVVPPNAIMPPIDISSFRTGHRPTSAELAAEIRATFEGQIPLREILNRIVQDAFGNLNELAEVMPSFGDLERKRKIIEYAVATRKQIIKVYAITKWAKVADDVQTALNVLSFLTRSMAKVTAARHILGSTAGILIPAKRRNADLITSLDVLHTGAYRKLPTVLLDYRDPEPISDADVITTLQRLNDAISYRLRLSEIIPVPMNDYRVADGRVTFTVPGKFEVVLSLTGPEATDYWQALDMQFLIAASGDDNNVIDDFPNDPHPWLKAQILNNLNHLLVLNSDPDLDRGDPLEEPPRRFPRDASRIDTPLVRAFNMLQMLSLSYQLEILHHQGARLLKLGWHEFLGLSMEMPFRRSFTATYWKRSAQFMSTQPGRPDNTPPHGGTITISIVEEMSTQSTTGSPQDHVSDALSQLESTVKLFGVADKSPTDHLEHLQLRVVWDPVPNALLVPVDLQDLRLELNVDPMNIDFSSIIRQTTRLHARGILRTLQAQLLKYGQKTIFTDPSEVDLRYDENTGYALRIHLCGSQAMIVSIDERTGRILIKDVGVFAASNRSGRFLASAVYVNRFPNTILRVLKLMKLEVILAEIEYQARYLGLKCTKSLSIPPSELAKKFGAIHVSLYIHLGPFTDYYLAMLASEDALKWALVNVQDTVHESFRMRSIVDFGWLDTDQIGGARSKQRQQRWDDLLHSTDQDFISRLPADTHHLTIKTEMLRELYVFCCARVSHTRVEQQLKSRRIVWTSVFPSPATDAIRPPEDDSAVSTSSCYLTPFSPTSKAIPIIGIRLEHLISSHGAGDVAYGNVKIKVVDWWSERPSRVITSVRLRDIQPTSRVGHTDELDETGRNITYDPTTSIVSFISSDVNTCVEEFLEEWERVQRVACIAREVGLLKARRQWDDIRITSFNLQSVEFVYHSRYIVSIQWKPPSASDNANAGGLYEMDFKVADRESDEVNPHHDIAAFLSKKLQIDATKSPARGVEALILILRESLPLLSALRKTTLLHPGRLALLTKTESWYRLLIDYRYAVDFRVLPKGKIIVADATASLFVPQKTREGLPVPAFSSFSELPGFQTAAESVARMCATIESTIPPVGYLGGGMVCSSAVVPDIIPQFCTMLCARVRS